MVLCKDCKHWRKIRDEDHQAEEGVVWPGPHGECMLIDEFSTDKKAWVYSSLSSLDNRLPVQNAEVEPSLITKPDFSCLLGETREAGDA